jgi:hypothetical protein
MVPHGNGPSIGSALKERITGEPPLQDCCGCHGAYGHKHQPECRGGVTWEFKGILLDNRYQNGYS